MTAPASVNLAADAALPQRDRLLDVDEVARRFSARLGCDGALGIQHCERLRVKYAPGASLRTVHRIQVGEASYTIAARTFTGGRSALAFAQTAERHAACAPLLPVVHDSELDTIYWTFPNDRKLTNLSALITPSAELATVGKARWTQSRVVAYAPEKCVTAACLNEENEVLAYAKIYADDEPDSHRVYLWLNEYHSTTTAMPRLPRLLAHSPAHRLMLIEPMAGRRLADLAGGERIEAFHHLGATLAALHELPVADGLPRFGRLDADLLNEAVAVIGKVRPDVGELANALAGELDSRSPGAPESPVFLHGDVHPKNGILQQAGQVALVDLDQAGRGPAAADLGSLLAALRYNRCTGVLSPAEERDLATAFLSGYRQKRGLPVPRSLRWHQAAALLAERALRAVGRVRCQGLSHLPELLTEALNLLREESPD